MSDPFEERLRCGVGSQTQDVPAINAGQAARPGDEEEAQGAHAPEQEGVGPLARPRLGFRHSAQLEAPHEVVGEHTELLPRAVGGVVVRRDDVERKLALEFGEGLLLGAPAAREGPRAASFSGMFVATAEYS